jgi:GTPase
MSTEKWLDNTSKVLTFIDVGGHKKAQKQLVSSLCSYFPEYALWVVSGVNKSPINPDTLELANIFHLPLIVVITHVDLMDKAM